VVLIVICGGWQIGRYGIVARLSLPLPALCRPWLFVVVIFILVTLFVCVTTAAAGPVVVGIAARFY
jgi:hypothetical protein